MTQIHCELNPYQTYSEYRTRSDEEDQLPKAIGRQACVPHSLGISRDLFAAPSTLFTAPRALKDPVLCSLSSLRWTADPTRPLSQGDGSTGVLSTWGSIRCTASRELKAIGLSFYTW